MSSRWAELSSFLEQSVGETSQTSLQALARTQLLSLCDPPTGLTKIAPALPPHKIASFSAQLVPHIRNENVRIKWISKLEVILHKDDLLRRILRWKRFYGKADFKFCRMRHHIVIEGIWAADDESILLISDEQNNLKRATLYHSQNIFLKIIWFSRFFLR